LLPGTGRGTMRSMVEGDLHERFRGAPSTTPCGRGPPPRSGEEMLHAPAMLEMRPDCERCGTDLPANAGGAFICSFECSFCAECADALDERCPNCGGELLDRPTRTG